MRKFALLSFMIWLQGNHIAVDVPHDGIKLRAVPVEEEPQGLLLIIDGNDIALIAIILRIVLQLPALRIIDAVNIDGIILHIAHRNITPPRMLPDKAVDIGGHTVHMTNLHLFVSGYLFTILQFQT